MQRAIFVTIVTALMVMGLASPMAHAYTYYSGWTSATTPANSGINVAQQQTLNSNQTLPDIAYITTDVQTYQRTVTLNVRVNGNTSTVYTNHSISYTSYSPYENWKSISQPNLTVKHDENGNVYYIVAWIEDEGVGITDTITAHYYNSNTGAYGTLPLNFTGSFTEYTNLSFSSSFSSDIADIFDPATNDDRISYSIRLQFYDENHYAWTIGKGLFDPAPGVYGRWHDGAGYIEYWQYLFIHDGNTTKRIPLTNDNWHEDRAYGNWYWSDDGDQPNSPGGVIFHYAPNPNDPYDDGALNSDGPDAVAYWCRSSSSLYVYRTDWTTTSLITVPGYTYWSWNPTYGIVASNLGTIHVLFRGYQTTPTYIEGIKDIIVNSDGTFQTPIVYQAPYSGGHNEEILDVVPKPGSSTDAFDILVSHYAEDEDGTTPNVTYVERVVSGSGSYDIIYEYYNSGGQLGATSAGNTSYKNAAYITGGLVKRAY